MLRVGVRPLINLRQGSKFAIRNFSAGKIKNFSKPHIQRTKEAYQGKKEELRLRGEEYLAQPHVEARKVALQQKSNQAKESAKEGAKNLKELWNKYGLISVGTYLGVYVGTLGTSFFMLQSGILSKKHAEHMKTFITKIHLDRFIDVSNDELAAKTGNFTIAWIFTKIVEPLRLGLTLAITPYVARNIRKFIRPL
eukprot:TRINITY_DN544484_c0_g1_i1.p1 TRINITY_DN544484_c0_g1~~TRINITY_DN544484_c0_g1_i1.p1  ORF type:complete len:195 (-),score=31.22 TRINITY_DN544484_c0_g1_i1:153-737(-)